VRWPADAKNPAFFLPFALFCFLLVFKIGSRPYFGDEISAILMARGSIGHTIAAAANDVHPPLYFLLLKVVRAAGGERAWALRLLSALFAAASFPFLWAAAKRFFGRSVGTAAWLLAASSFVIFASRFVRYYSLGLLETAAATYLLLRVLERPDDRRLWTAYGIVLALSLYTFYLSAIVIAAHWLVFLAAWRREPRRFIAPLLVAAGVGLAFLPWAGVLGRQLSRVNAGQADVGLWHRLVAAVAQTAYTFYAFAASDSISPFALPFSAALAVFCAIIAALGFRSAWRAATARSRVIWGTLAIGAAVPAAMRLAGWLPGPFIYLPVRLLFIAPFFILILACGILAVADRKVRTAAFATLLGIQAVSLFNYYTQRQWTNWAYVVPMPEIVAYVEQNARPDDLVILDEWNLCNGPFFYWRGKAEVFRFGPAVESTPPRLAEVRRIWVIRAVRDNSPGEQVNRLLLHIKRNFVLKERRAYVREPSAIYEKKRHWLRREVFRHKIELLRFERPATAL